MDHDTIAQFERTSPLRLLAILNRLNQNSLTGSLAAIGMARGNLPFVMEVLSGEGVIQEDISRSLAIDRAATARALQQLETEGFVERVEDPRDRRQKRVYATERTWAMSADILDILKGRTDLLFSGFDEQEQAQFLSMLDRMIRNMLAPKDT